MVVRAAAWVKVRGALARGDAAGGLDAGCREPIMGGQGTGARVGGRVLVAGGAGGGGLPGRRRGRGHCHSHIRVSGSQIGDSQDGAPD